MKYALSIILVLAVIAPTLRAAPPAGEVILSSDLANYKLAGARANKATSAEVDVTGQPFTRAFRIGVKERVTDYEIQLAAPITQSLQKNDVLLLTAYARLIDTADESGEGYIGFVLEQAKDPFNKSFSAKFGVKSQWQRFDIPTLIHEDFSKTGAHLAIRLGDRIQTLEVGGIELQRFPQGTPLSDLPRTKVTYPGREENAPWRKAAADRIEQIRKAALSITVVDAAGHPIPGAQVDVQMKRHAFVFGSCYAPGLILGLENNNPSDVEQYRSHFLKLFNTGTDEYQMKWPGWVNPQTRQHAMDALAWMEEHHIAVRGHNMVWPGWKRLPPEIKQYADDPAALRQQIRDHILSVGSALKGHVIDWDVVNEPYANNDLLKILGEQAMADWFKTAHEADPNAKLYLNETNVPTSPPNDDHYTALYNRAKMVEDAGAPIDGVGMQAHFGQNFQPPVRLLGIYDRFAKLGIPTRITELDIDCDDEQLQADYYRDFLTASFSHPNINGIVIWGFWEGAHWRPNAAMYRTDWSPRPIAGVWNDLVFKQWWTNAQGVTAKDGAFATRGFLGTYEITITGGDKKKTLVGDLAKNGLTLQAVLD